MTELSYQRTPWGGGKKEGGGKPSRMTPLPKRGFGPPLVRYVFHPPQVSIALFFLYKNPRQSRPEALLGGSQNFRESAFSGTFSSPHTFCTPPCHGPILCGVLQSLLVYVEQKISTNIASILLMPQNSSVFHESLRQEGPLPVLSGKTLV